MYVQNNSLFVSVFATTNQMPVFSACDGSTLQNLWFQREWQLKLLSQHEVARKLEDLVTRTITLNGMLSIQSLSLCVSIRELNELFGQLAGCSEKQVGLHRVTLITSMFNCAIRFRDYIVQTHIYPQKNYSPNSHY